MGDELFLPLRFEGKEINFLSTSHWATKKTRFEIPQITNSAFGSHLSLVTTLCGFPLLFELTQSLNGHLLMIGALDVTPCLWSQQPQERGSGQEQNKKYEIITLSKFEEGDTRWKRF
jgi:hypothetical protein